MRSRLGPGPVFVYEWLTATRRWQLYAVRAAFVGVILIGMILVWTSLTRSDRSGQTVSIQEMARYGEAFYSTVVAVELTLVLLAAPAATAGAVCLDKARGTLDHILATDLSNAEIVLGKLGVRLAPVLGLVACVLPITALSGLLGGIDPDALFGSFLVAIGCAALGCSLAMALSVWGRKTHEVLMMTYLILILWLSFPMLVILVALSLGLPFPRFPLPILWEWLLCTNPYYLAFAPYSDPGKVGMMTYLGFLGVCLFFSGLVAGLATLRIRGVALKQAGQPAGGPRRSRSALALPRWRWLPQLPGPSLEDNPVLWREWHRSKPSRFLRLAWLLYAGLGVLWIVLALRIVNSGHRGDDEMIAAMNVFQVAVGLLLVSVSAATSLAEERVRGSLDVLLSTPLSTRTILAGKWWGAFRQVLHILIWPAVTTAFLIAGSGRVIAYLGLLALIAAYGAGITSLGLALATWVSRLGRAVALCVVAYVVFSIGWVVLIFLVSVVGRLAPNDHLILPLIMGSPLYGTLFATLAASLEPLRMPGGGAEVGVGTFLWILIHGGAAAALFAATVASFDRCLGRVSETPGRPVPGSKKKPAAELELEL